MAQIAAAPDLAGVAALALIALCCLLPVIGAVIADMRRVMRHDPAAFAATRELLTRQAVELSYLDSHARSVLARAYADGIFPDRRRHPRNTQGVRNEA